MAFIPYVFQSVAENRKGRHCYGVRSKPFPVSYRFRPASGPIVAAFGPISQRAPGFYWLAGRLSIAASGGTAAGKARFPSLRVNFF
ncbi:MAG: hypothetical protein J0H18_11475 [Rhizobiales bacterium]|nr:hypothetical protein [Hyphomicrobiales bacterium]OJY06735.1 MAG: hypothetical protein BGP07_17035 [Rhizobiales bacterium 63-22]